MVEQATRMFQAPYPYQKHDSPLCRVIQEMPYMARCSSNKTACLSRPRELAVLKPYTQVNRPNVVSWLIFDLDHPNAAIWEDEQLPPPNLIVRNRCNGKAHLFYAIEPVLTGSNARVKPIAYMKAVYQAFRGRLQADEAYSGPVAKTPGHRWWQTTEVHNRVYDLNELAEYVTLTVKPYWSKEPDLGAVSHSRHEMLFEKLRFFAYSIVTTEREQGTYQSFTDKLHRFATLNNNFTINGFRENLRASQVRATVKSVSRWTWTRYTGRSRCNRGVMALTPDLPLRCRQSQAAGRTHNIRKADTTSRIKAAYANLKLAGAKTTYVNIAKTAGLSRQTVSKYAHLLRQSPKKQTVKPAKVLPFTQPAVNSEDVIYGTHQISTQVTEALSFPGQDQITRWIQWLRRPPEAGDAPGYGITGKCWYRPPGFEP